MSCKFLMFILFFPSILLAQERQGIKVFGVTKVSLNVFYLNIKKDKNIIEVSYKIQDSLS